MAMVLRQETTLTSKIDELKKEVSVLEHNIIKVLVLINGALAQKHGPERWSDIT